MSTGTSTSQPDSLVLLNTGDGKGKTTAAFGVVVRALARDWRVGVIQFLKSDEWKTGEEDMFRSLGVEWLKGGDGFTWKTSSEEGSRSLAQATWRRAAAALREGEFRLLVLDELTLPVAFGWLDEKEVAEAIRSRQKGVNVIITGRDASKVLMDLADTVTDMRSVRHPFAQGVVARPGIDY